MGTYLDFRIKDPSTDDSGWMARAPDRLSDSTIATEVNEWLHEQPVADGGKLLVDDPETHHAPATDFETMADRIRRGHYTSHGDGYASSGFRVFDANKFARDLGFDKSTLTDDIGLVEDADRAGLSGLRQPTVDELAERWDELKEHRAEELIEWAQSQGKDIEIVRRDSPDTS